MQAGTVAADSQLVSSSFVVAGAARVSAAAIDWQNCRSALLPGGTAEVLRRPCPWALLALPWGRDIGGPRSGPPCRVRTGTECLLLVASPAGPVVSGV